MSQISSRRFTLRECVTLPPEELKQACLQDFMALVDVTVAEAAKPDMPASVKEWLRSPEQVENWSDALRWAASSLEQSVEWKAYSNDERLSQTVELRNDVARRVDESNRLRGQYKRAEYRNSEDFQKSLDAGHTARGWLTHYYKDEFNEIRRELATQRGIAPDLERMPQNGSDEVEFAIADGLFLLEDSSEVRAMRDLPREEFEDVVKADAQDPDERVAELRHPLLLHRWQSALRSLAEETGVGMAKGMALPRLDRRELMRMPRSEAVELLNRRRSFASYLHRLIECRQVTREVMVAIQTRRRERDVQRVEVAAAARVELAERHPGEFDYILTQVAAKLAAIEQEAGEPRGMLPGEIGPLRKQIFAELDNRTE